MRLLVSAGGTGGHILPALATVAELGIWHPDAEVLWIGTAGEMEERLVPQAGLALETIPGGGLHGVGLITGLRNGVRLAQGWQAARQLVRRFRPDVAFLTGGYTNLPTALAARERRVPMAIFLPDVEPGLAIRLLSRIARRVACTVRESQSYLPREKMIVTGYPVRPGLVPAMSQSEARLGFGLAPDVATVLVFGGSRGARTINNALLTLLPDLLADTQVIHITGQLDSDRVAAKAEMLPTGERTRYRTFAYLDAEMGHALRAADLVISRAGAATLGEFPAFGLPAILVPYPYAWRYQKVNAEYLAQAGAAVHLPDEDMAAELLPTVRRLLSDDEELRRMSAAMQRLDKPDAARQIADLLLELARKG
jgi:UDP-N-acetylglucosamine--N-acetylmuramyl-(pentapeptide) pyrophosphoryl-undecaprenol N-acetylglucosamine transferase